MSLQFYFGASGAGKSKKLHDDIIEESLRHPKKNYLLIVPDQFTMQTQMDLVVEHPRHAIMNIDVLSFGRLTHRVLEEVGGEDLPILDDTGKSLVLRKVAGRERENLKALGSHLHKIGYIHEVKSALSEFMQYGVGGEGTGNADGIRQGQRRPLLQIAGFAVFVPGFSGIYKRPLYHHGRNP